MAKAVSKHKERRRIFIVDDHPVFREGLLSLVKSEPEWQVCGEADSAGQALTAIERLKPNLVLADIGLQGRSGMELLKDLHAVDPALPVLVVSMHDEALYAERVLRAGARGYIMKQEAPEKMIEAIRLVISGQIYLSSRVSSQILDAIAGRRVQDASPMTRLTDRELEILQLIGQGKDGRTIARLLNVSSKTVDAHRGHIKEKLNLKNATELVAYASRWVEAQINAQ